GNAGLSRSLVVVDAELLLQYAVVALGLLLLAQLEAILALALATTTVLARGVRAPLDAALVGQAALALEEELLAFAAALLALGSGVTRQDSHPPALARATAIVCLRSDIADDGHLEGGGLARTDRRLAAGSRALHEPLYALQPMLDALARGGVGGHLRGEWRRLAAA